MNCLFLEKDIRETNTKEGVCVREREREKERVSDRDSVCVYNIKATFS